MMNMENKNNGLVYDSLTGVLSFKSFMEEAQRILDENSEKQYMILAWDIERFKVVNDIFGMAMVIRSLRISLILSADRYFQTELSAESVAISSYVFATEII